MNAERQFPIMGYWRGRRRGEPFMLPWDFIQPHEKQAQLNHHQSLDALARRGGLDPTEALDILLDQPFATSRLTWEDATTKVQELLAAYLQRVKA